MGFDRYIECMSKTIFILGGGGGGIFGVTVLAIPGLQASVRGHFIIGVIFSFI